MCKQPGLWSTHGRPIDHSSDARGCWSHHSKYSQEYKAKTITQINSFYCIINDLPESDATTARAESVWKRLKSENKAEKLAIQLYYSLEKRQQHIYNANCYARLMPNIKHSDKHLSTSLMNYIHIISWKYCEICSQRNVENLSTV